MLPATPGAGPGGTARPGSSHWFYYALGDGEQGRKNVHDYYSFSGDFAGLMASAVCDTPQKVREAVASFEGIGADDLIFNTGTDDIDDIKRLADIVL